MNKFYWTTRLLATALAVAVTASSAFAAPKRVLFFSKSSGFEHDVIKTHDGQPSFVDKILTDLGEKNNIEFTCTKDGSLFTPENIAKYDAFFFYTTGDLTKRGTDGNPPMTPEAKQQLLDAIHNGKGFIGTHCASDTFHGGDGDDADPYIKMLGGEFLSHGGGKAHFQSSHMIIVDKSFPGIADVPDDWAPVEEWYSLKNLQPDLHVILVQDTSNMIKDDGGKCYDRPNYPATWAKQYGKGRVFYTNMGHREDIWTSPIFQKVLLGGLNWALGNVEADVTPNVEKVTPQYTVLPPK